MRSFKEAGREGEKEGVKNIIRYQFALFGVYFGMGYSSQQSVGNVYISLYRYMALGA